MTHVNSYLFAWNPKNWRFEDLERYLIEIEKFGITTIDWKVQSTKKIRTGDRAYIMRVGDNFRGIFASGTISKLPYQGPYFKNPNQMVPKVDIEFDVLLNPFTTDNLTIEKIKSAIPSSQFWTPHQSGIQIRVEVAEKLEVLWKDFYNQVEQTMPKILVQSIFEGIPYAQIIKSYERSKFARALCLAEYGYDCSVCEMNFQRTYGEEIGNGFIHVHHINEMAVLDSGRYTDPVKDLRPVCPNCHGMLHRKKPAMKIEDLKLIFANYRTLLT